MCINTVIILEVFFEVATFIPHMSHRVLLSSNLVKCVQKILLQTEWIVEAPETVKSGDELLLSEVVPLEVVHVVAEVEGLILKVLVEGDVNPEAIKLAIT